jgi:hypothetical protein
MARVLAAGERAKLATQFVPRIRVQLENQGGDWQDMSNFNGRDYFTAVTWRESFDTNVASGSLTLARQVGGESIAPTVSAALANHPGGGAYSAFIRGRQKVRILTATKAPADAEPIDADYREIFRGRVDDPEYGGTGNQMTLAIADQGSWLMTKMIDTVRTYSDDVGQSIESVMQQILDDNPVTELGALTLFVPTSPAVNIKAYSQDRVPVLTALITLAEQIAWDVRFMYDPTDGVSKLTLYEPPRDKTTADWSFGPDEYYNLPNVGLQTDDVKSRGKLFYTDEATGERASVDYLNPDAAAIFGDSYFEIGESATSNINTAAEAQRMLDAIGADLSAPPFNHVMETAFFWPAQLYDVGVFAPNSQHYDEPQTLAVVGVEHNLTPTTRRTTLTTRGQVAGAYARWLAIASKSTNPPTTEGDHPQRPQLSTFTDPDTGSVDVIVDVSADTTAVKVAGHAGASATIPTIEETRAAASHLTGGARRIVVSDVMTVDETGDGYVSALAYDALGDESPLASIAVGSPTPDVTPTLQLLHAVPNSITGLTVDVGLRVVSPTGAGGFLRVWTNHDGTNDPNPNGPIEGTLAIGATPATVDETSSFLVGGVGPGTFQYLNDIRVYPTQGKIIFAEFVDSDGNTSGQIAMTIRGGGGILDDSGNLKPGAIFTPSQITDGLLTMPKMDPTLKIPVTYSSLPATGPQGVGSIAVVGTRTYKWNGSAWVDMNSAVDMVGQITTAQITAGAIGPNQMDSTIRPPVTVASLPATGAQGVGSLVIMGGRIYQWNGSSWVDQASAANMSGQIAGAQIASGAIGATNLASGLEVVQNVATIASANFTVSHSAYNQADGRLYQWNASLGWVPVNTASLMVGQITAGQITAGAIGTTQLAAGAVTAGIIAAGAVTADKLFVSGGVGAALNVDPQCADPSAWIDDVSGLPPTATLTSGGKVGQTCFISPVGVPLYLDGRKKIPVDPLKVYRVRAWVYGSGANGQLYLGVRGFDGAGGEHTGGGGGAFYTSHVTSIPDGWTQYVGNIGPGQVDGSGFGWSTDVGASGVVNVQMYALINYLGTAGQCLIQDFRLEEVLPGTLIRDGAITTQKVAALAITSDLLAANSATFGKVAAGAIGVDQMRANSVGADQVIAGSITTDKLYVSGGLGQALNADPSLHDATAWSMSNGSIVTLTDGVSGTTAIRTTTGNFGNITATAAVPFDRNKIYRFHVWLRRSTTAPGYFYYGGTFRNGDGTASNSNGGYIYAAHSGESIPTANTWYEYSGTLSVPEGSVPSSAAYFYPILYLNYPIVGTAGYVEAQDFRVEEVLPGTLIKDGAITTAKLTALSVTSNELAANSAIFGKVAAGAIGTDQLIANAITAGKIAAGAVQADKLIVTWAPGGAINLDPMTSDLSAWTIDLGPGIASVTGKVGSRALFSGVGTAGAYRTKQLLRLDWANKTYRIHGWVFRSADSNGLLYLGLWCYRKSDGAQLGGVYAPGGVSPTLGAWSEYSTHLNAATFAAWSQDPDNVGDAQLYALINYTGTAGYYYLQDFRIEEVQPGTLIKDGSILTQHLTSTTVTAAVMSVGSLQSISTDMGVLVSGKLQSAANGTYLDLNATGGNPVLHHANFDLYANGAASFRGDITGASGTFSGAISSSSFTTGQANFAGKVYMQGTLKIIGGGTGFEEFGLGGITFNRYSDDYSYAKIYLDGVATLALQGNAGISMDAGSSPLAVNAYALTVNSAVNVLNPMLTIANTTYGTLISVDVPTNNNDTGLSIIYRNESGAYSFKRVRGDNTNTGGSGNRNLRVLN